jgi:tetratricopeptide (TPR) repeat protein
MSLSLQSSQFVRCVGRDTERALLRQWLDDEAVRIVHVCGASGVGKSTLVRALLDDCRRRGARVVAVERPVARTVSGYLRQIHDAFGTAADLDLRTSSIVERLHQKFAERARTVVVLDGVDRHKELIAALIGRFRTERFSAVLLVVSRTREVGAPDRRLRLGPLDADGALACGIQHAEWRSSPGGGRFDVDTLAKVVRACAGHPLAIGLAVARLQVHEARDVVDWLRRRSRTTRERIKLAVAEAYAELATEERRALMILSAIDGSPAVALAEHLLEAEGCARALSVLRDAGMVWLCASSRGRTAGEYVWVHDAFMQLAKRDAAQSGEGRALPRRVREGIVEFGETLVDEFGRPRERGAATLLTGIRPQLESILEHEAPSPAWARAALLMNSAFDVAMSRRRTAILSRALARIGNEKSRDDRLVMRLRLARGRAIVQHGDVAGALDDVIAARALAESLGSREGLVLASLIETIGRVHRGEFAMAEAQAARTMALASGLDDRLACEAQVLLAFALHQHGEYTRAVEQANGALALAQATGDARLIGYAAQHCAGMYLHAGEVERTRSLCLVSLRAARQAGSALVAAVAVRGLGLTELIRGGWARAIRLLRRSSEMFRRVDNGRGRAHSLMYLGVALIAGGSLSSALDTLAEALSTGMTRQHAAMTHAFIAFGRALLGQHAAADGALVSAREHLNDDTAFARELVAWVERALPRGETETPSRTAPLPGATASFEIGVLARILAERPHRRACDTPNRQVALSGAWFVAYDGSTVSLEQRPALKRLVAALARGAMAGRGPMRPVALHDACWPKEEERGAAALNRLRVSIWTLRHLGFVGLESARGGYWLEGVCVIDDERPSKKRHARTAAERPASVRLKAARVPERTGERASAR